MITPQQIEAIGQYAAQQPVSEDILSALRKDYADIHFTYCQDDDVFAATPVFRADAFNLYLIDSRNHCLSFTQDPQIATGVVVAELEDE